MADFLYKGPFFIKSMEFDLSFMKSTGYVAPTYTKPFKANGNYDSHLLQQSITLHFVLIGFV
jgi:hypothetical protein